MNIDDEFTSRSPEPLVHLSYDRPMWVRSVIAFFVAWCVWCAYLILTTHN